MLGRVAEVLGSSRATIHPVATLDGLVRGGMFLLLDGLAPPSARPDPWAFYRDLRGSRDVLIARDGEGRIVGFVGLTPIDVAIGAGAREQTHRVVLSGAPIGPADAHPTLARAALRYLTRERRRAPDGVLWWAVPGREPWLPLGGTIGFTPDSAVGDVIEAAIGGPASVARLGASALAWQIAREVMSGAASRRDGGPA